MALTFGAATSDLVNCGSGISMDNPGSCTMLVWVYPTTLTNSRVILNKNINDTADNGHLLSIRSTGQIQINGTCTGGTSMFQRSDTPAGNILTTNAWNFVAAVANTNLTGKLYLGTLTTTVVEVAYAAGGTTGVTAYSDDSAGVFLIGNGGAHVRPIEGTIAVASYWNTALTLAQIQDQQFFPHIAANCVGFWRLNNSTTGTQYDLSGFQNNGTVTGATVATIADPAGIIFADKSGPNLWSHISTGAGISVSESAT